MIQEIEHKFLSLILRDSSFIPKSLASVSDDVFSSDQGKWLFNTICDHFTKFGIGISKTALKTRLQETFLDGAQSEYLLYAQAVAVSEPSDKDFEFYIDRLQNGKVYRSILTTLQETASFITPDNAFIQLSKLESKISGIRSSSVKDAETEHDLGRNVIDRMKKFDTEEDDSKGIPMPIAGLNEALGGLKKTHLVVVSGVAGSGKSMMLLQFANHAHLLRKNVVFVTLEMSYVDLEARFHSLVTGLDSKKIMNKTLSQEEKRVFYNRVLKRHIPDSESKNLSELFKLNDVDLGLTPTDEEKKLFGEAARIRAFDRFAVKASAIKTLDNRFFILDAPGGMTIPRLKSNLKNISNRFPIDLLVVDYINIMASGLRDQESWQEGAAVSRSLKQIAREYKIPVLSASQLNIGKGDDKKISQADMRYSKAITENSDFVIAFRRTEKDEMMGIIRLELLKHRHSEFKTITVREKFKSMSIENLMGPASS